MEKVMFARWVGCGRRSVGGCDNMGSVVLGGLVDVMCDMWYGCTPESRSAAGIHGHYTSTFVCHCAAG